MKKILVITGGGLNTRFNTDIPKYLLPSKNKQTILEDIILNSTDFDEVVLIINEKHEKLWCVKNYVGSIFKGIVKCIVLPKQTPNPVETIRVSGVLEKYPHDKLYFKDCDTVYKISGNEERIAETYTVKKFGFSVNKRYSILTKKGIVEKPKIPWYKYLCVYNANIGCYVFPPCKLRPLLFLSEKSTGVLCGKLKPINVHVDKYMNFESLKKYGEIIK